MRRAYLLLILGAMVLAACGQPKLRDLRPGGEGPDEFIVAPSLPLQEPASFSDLPAPTPGGSNITDPNPLADGVAALGGRRGAPNAPVPAADAGIVSYAQRGGVSPGIRAQLAEEDADFRRRKARFTNIRLFPEDRYAQAYRREALDPFRVADAYRRAGIKTPTHPPANGR